MTRAHRCALLASGIRSQREQEGTRDGAGPVSELGSLLVRLAGPLTCCDLGQGLLTLHSQ
jgi:hypothetical protein